MLRLIAFRIEVELEEDGRWLAEIAELPGVLAYGISERDAIDKAKALALRVIADRIEHGESAPEPISAVFSIRGIASGAA
jgi:predicted RNase H-like HicB family nuclease